MKNNIDRNQNFEFYVNVLMIIKLITVLWQSDHNTLIYYINIIILKYINIKNNH